MALPWARRRESLQRQQRTEEQLSTSTVQLFEVGQIIGRLNAVASRFEAVATRIVEACEDDTDEPTKQNGTGKDERAAK